MVQAAENGAHTTSATPGMATLLERREYPDGRVCMVTLSGRMFRRPIRGTVQGFMTPRSATGRTPFLSSYRVIFEFVHLVNI